MHVSFYGHSFFQVKLGEQTILFDPFIQSSSDDPAMKRLVSCPVGVDDLKGISMIFITSEVFDHFDKQSVEYLAEKWNATVVAHQSVLNELKISPRLMRPIQTGSKLSVRGVSVEAQTAHYPQAFYPLGYKLTHNGESVYHAGDTDLSEYPSTFTADVALLPIGGTITMDVVDAVKATKSLKPRIVIPMHYNTFSMIQASPEEFVQRIEKSILKTKPVLLKPGESAEV
ncbi:MAG: MBL fold metallo-hydrolase [Candidatus Diapherotrites archaeon]|nr:MBL fold metallo-hydrolase [Candidatus Diapherotrites archaeon]